MLSLHEALFCHAARPPCWKLILGLGWLLGKLGCGLVRLRGAQLRVRTAMGRLGLRNAVLAFYILQPFGALTPLCAPDLSRALAQYSATVAPSDALPTCRAPTKQQTLSNTLDAQELRSLFADPLQSMVRLQGPTTCSSSSSWGRGVAASFDALGLSLKSSQPSSVCFSACPFGDGVAECFGGQGHSSLRPSLAERVFTVGLSPGARSQVSCHRLASPPADVGLHDPALFHSGHKWLALRCCSFLRG